MACERALRLGQSSFPSPTPLTSITSNAAIAQERTGMVFMTASPWSKRAIACRERNAGLDVGGVSHAGRRGATHRLLNVRVFFHAAANARQGKREPRSVSVGGGVADPARFSVASSGTRRGCPAGLSEASSNEACARIQGIWLALGCSHDLPILINSVHAMAHRLLRGEHQHPP
jgi:hypothetical protein